MTATSSKVWTLLFEPLGVLVFRDDRPFDAGQHSLAVSRFPLPSVFRGAVRTALFERAGADFRAHPNFGLPEDDRVLLGGSDRQESFEMRGPLVARRAEDDPWSDRYDYVLPWPGDLVPIDSTKRYAVLSPRGTNDAGPTCLRLGPPRGEAPTRARSIAELSPQHLPWTDEEPRKASKGTQWLTVAGAKAYVEHSEGTNPLPALEEGVHWLDQAEILDKETRVGIARATESEGDSLVAADSMLYTLVAWRMGPRYRFAVEVLLGGLPTLHIERLQRLLDQLDGQLVRLGGKSGHARVQVLKRSIAPKWAQPDPTKAATTSKLWLWTPGIFDPSEVPGLAAAVGGSMRLGGFDMANFRPRPLVGALDRGTVLWLSALDREALEQHQRALARSHNLPLASYGYGHWMPRSNT